MQLPALRDDIHRVITLCRQQADRAGRMKWMWGDGLFGFALSQWDVLMGTEEFTPFLTAYCDQFMLDPPVVDFAERAAPALVSYAMQKKPGNERYWMLTQKVLHYIRHAPRMLGDAVNHLGQSFEGRFYPRSIWVESLMMFSVFPAVYARDNGDHVLLDFAARQPRIYSGFMQDKERKLWYHSYWVKAKRHHPKGQVFWARGNGWVMAALPTILDQIGENHPEYEGMLRIFRDTAQAVLKCENADHSYSTLLTHKSYRELSATALIAAGLMHAARKGYLEESYGKHGLRIFHTMAQAIGQDSKGLFMPDISVGTIPMPVLPRLFYRLTRRGRNLSHGLAAALFAAIEAQQLLPE